MTILNDDHTEPHICVTNSKTGEILSQIFNFLDFIGGKSAVTAESKTLLSNFRHWENINHEGYCFIWWRSNIKNVKRVRSIPICHWKFSFCRRSILARLSWIKTTNWLCLRTRYNQHIVIRANKLQICGRINLSLTWLWRSF